MHILMRGRRWKEGVELRYPVEPRKQVIGGRIRTKLSRIVIRELPYPDECLLI